MKITKNLEIEDTLNKDATLDISMVNPEENETCIEHIDQEEAVQIVCHLIKVFQIPTSNIEVIYFREGLDRAKILRHAADRLDSRPKKIGEGNGE
jgi:hypothetical protein